MKYAVAFLLAFLPASLATAETNASLRSMIVGMAQHFVQEQYMLVSLATIILNSTLHTYTRNPNRITGLLLVDLYLTRISPTPM